MSSQGFTSGPSLPTPANGTGDNALSFWGHTPRPRYWLHLLLLVVTLFTTTAVGARMVENFRLNRPAFGVDDLAPVFRTMANPASLPQGLAVLAGIDNHSAGPRTRPLRGLPLLPRERKPAVFHPGRRSSAPSAPSSASGPRSIPSRCCSTSGSRARSPASSSCCPRFPSGWLSPRCFPASTSAAISSSACRCCSGCWNRSIFPGVRSADIYLHPLARAAWVGIFSTALNLLPIGQLDGGHILYSVVGERHKLLSAYFRGGTGADGPVFAILAGLGAGAADHRTAAPRDLRYHRTGSGPKAPGLAGPGDLCAVLHADTHRQPCVMRPVRT